MGLIGKRIKDLRIKRGFTQTELADMVGISKQTLYKYENGVITNIPSDNIENIADKLSVNPGYIMGWTDNAGKIIVENDEFSQVSTNNRLLYYAKKLDSMDKEKQKLIFKNIDYLSK